MAHCAHPLTVPPMVLELPDPGAQFTAVQLTAPPAEKEVLVHGVHPSTVDVAPPATCVQPVPLGQDMATHRCTPPGEPVAAPH